LGPSGAGKSSLLGALARAAEVQAGVLDGHVTHAADGLVALGRSLYEGKSNPANEEIIYYPLALEHRAGTRSSSRLRRETLLVDCDGRAANELLATGPADEAPDGTRPLASAVRAADTLLLVVDVADVALAPECQFQQFVRFVHLLEECRGERADVGGLPVFLVLAKCDLLARPGDTPAAWIDRIEERKRQVAERFQQFPEHQPETRPLRFGAMDLHVWATAVKRPALADCPAQPREPFGVAELFRQSFDEAASFRVRRRRSRRRLVQLVAGTACTLVAMAAMAVGLLVGRPEAPASELAQQVEAYRLREEDKTPAEWLRPPLGRKLSRLEAFRNHGDFRFLAPGDQDFINRRLDELRGYIQYHDRLDEVDLADVTTVAGLEAIEARLTNELAPPARYAEAWAQTESVERRAAILAAVKALRIAVRETASWYRGQSARAEELRAFAAGRPADAPAWSDWFRQARSALQAPAPHAEGDDIAGARALTYGTVYRIDHVVRARQDAESSRRRLDAVCELVAALGLAGPLPDGERQPLDIPDRLPLDQTAAYRQRLERFYPRLAKSDVPELPDAVAADLCRAAGRSYEHLLEAGRDAVLAHLRQGSAGSNEVPELWRRLVPWLADPPELRDWHRLAVVLRRIADRAGDPVLELADFIRRDPFALNLQAATLEIPLDRALRPAGSITVFHGRPGAEPAPALNLRLAGEDGQRDPARRVTAYTFRAEPAAPVIYHPGDGLYACLPVRRDGDGREWLLTWARGRSMAFQFERLARPPRLHLKDQENTQGELLEDVTLSVTPEDGVPKVPELVPVVKLNP
jgi:hypothetical protein